MRTVLAVLLLMVLSTSCTRRGTYTSIPVVDPASTTQPLGLEPGEAEARERAANLPLPTTGKILDAHPELLSMDFAGRRSIHRSFGDFYSMCPSNPRTHEILATLYAEAVRKYPCDGLNLDRIRYADTGYCYCDYCKATF